ncbi:hypothetical protein ACFV6F_20105 [Kitasatospora phosalacinea]|uniref:hypothetical protein n=1 Tax=Kitasatospora phosalacinea TaxID=2065 RepID=UPI00364DF272
MNTAASLPADTRPVDSLLADSLLADIERIESFLNGTEPVLPAPGATIPCASADDLPNLPGGPYC